MIENKNTPISNVITLADLSKRARERRQPVWHLDRQIEGKAIIPGDSDEML